MTNNSIEIVPGKTFETGTEPIDEQYNKLKYLSLDDYPALKQETLLGIRDDLGAEFPRFLDLFAGQCKSLSADILNGLEGNDQELLKNSLHSLKGGCGAIGAMRMFHLCKQLEMMGEIKNQEYLISILEKELLMVDLAIKETVQEAT